MAVYLNTYQTHQAYGGPEEGGWTFECGTPVQSIFCSDQDLDAFLETTSWEERTELMEKTNRTYTKGLAPTPKKTGYGGYTFMPDQGTDDMSFCTYEEDNSYQTFFEDHYAIAYPQERPTYE